MMMLEKVLRWIAIGGVFALPFVCLIVSTSLFFPFITGKNFAFRLIVEVMTAAWLALAFVSPMYRPKRPGRAGSWILGALALFVLVIGLADAFGAVPFKSFWSNFERMDGWVTLAHLLLYTTVAASVMQTENLWRRLFQTSLVLSGALSVYGFLQIIGVTALGQGGDTGLTARIDATFGNPIYFAAYMLFHVFLAAMLWAQSWVERDRGGRIAPSLLYGLVIVLDTAALFFTGTRGAMLGLIGGTLLSCLLLVFFARNSRNAWRAATAAVAGILILAGAFWMVRDAAWVQRVGFLQRLASISIDDATTKARFLNWGIAWEGIKERPILGWGQENYAIVFDKHFDPRMHGQEPWFDRVHNVVFDWLVAGGFLGLFAYLSIFGAALWALWRRTREGIYAFTIAERSILTGLLAAYFCHNFFVFDNVTSYILFGTVLAYIAQRASSARGVPAIFASRKLDSAYLPYLAITLAILLWAVAWFVNARALEQNRALLQAVGPQENIAINLDYFERAIAVGSLGTQEAREQLAQAASQVAGMNAPEEVKQAFFTLATSEMEKQHEASPLDARFPLFLGAVYQAYGQLDSAKVWLDTAQTLSPEKQTILFERGQNAFNRGSMEEALALFREAHELAPEIVQSRILYASVAVRAGQDALASQILAPIVESGEAADQRILAAYVDVGRLQPLIPLWRARIQAKPDDVQAYFTLAAVYYELGNRTEAINALEAAKAAHPSVAAQADPLIQQIRAGTADIGR